MYWNFVNIYSILFTCSLSLLCIFAQSTAFAVSQEELPSTIMEQLELRPAVLLGLEGHGLDSAHIDRVLADTYHENSLQPFWVGVDGPGEKAQIIFDAVKESDKEGLIPEDYHVSKIDKYWSSTDAVGLVRLDILLTLAVGGYVADMRAGRLNPGKVNPELFAGARDVELDLVKMVEQILAASDLQEFLKKQGPSHERYHKLLEALASYRNIAARGGWEPVPDGETLRPGMNDERVPKIRKRLYLTGDIESDDFSSILYDEELLKAVKHFQMRYGLSKDGILGKGTLAAMNLPVETLIRGIEMNMERSRWISHDLGDVRVAVTIAGFKLGVFNNGKLDLAMPVIVGKQYHMTPVFSDMIKYLEINPYWNIPPSIARNEMLPKLKKNPMYLKERNIRVFSSWGEDGKELDSTTIDWNKVGRNIVRYKLRQDPGPDNALGTVKFMFPNSHNVYLHDTPTHSLFNKTDRAFSHGCIRVSRPVELAAYLLGGEEQGWSMERIKEIISSGKRTVVRLEKPVPVHITYRTVWIGPDDSVRFSKDIYGRDKMLEAALYDSVLR
jgi:murein L,D-transpeptidase YcbB/YkuD